MAHLALQCLGGFEARVAAGPPVEFPTRKAKGLLAYLARQPGRRASRDLVGALLWGSCGDERARNNVRQTLMLVRRALRHSGHPCIVSDGDALYLDPGCAEVDVAEFDELCREQSSDALERAVALYRGEFLEGLVLHEELYEEWLRAERADLQERALEGLTTLLRRQLGAGHAEQGIRIARRILSLDPLRETAHRALMRLWADIGDRALALRQYQRCRDILRAELGVEPEPETQRLCDRSARKIALGTATAWAMRRRRCRTSLRLPSCPSST